MFVGWVERQRRPNAGARWAGCVGSALRLTQPPLIAAACCIIATPAAAHGFGQRYELPVPLTLYLWGAAAAVVLSFAMFGLFIRRTHMARAPESATTCSPPHSAAESRTPPFSSR